MRKRHNFLPSLLLIYTLVMAVIAYPKFKESGNWVEYLTIIGGCILIAFVLYFILKRKQKLRDKFSGKN